MRRHCHTSLDCAFYLTWEQHTYLKAAPLFLWSSYLHSKPSNVNQQKVCNQNSHIYWNNYMNESQIRLKRLRLKLKASSNILHKWSACISFKNCDKERWNLEKYKNQIIKSLFSNVIDNKKYKKRAVFSSWLSTFISIYNETEIFTFLIRYRWRL